jgi:starvation-inducible DNA-binding protein
VIVGLLGSAASEAVSRKETKAMEAVTLPAQRLYPTSNDIPGHARAQLVVLLNKRLADGIDLQTQAKTAHWNVKGQSFIALHKLFDEFNDTVAQYVDSIAERAVQLGGIAEGTARIVAQRSELDEYPMNIGEGQQHVQAMSAALARFGARVRRAIEEAEGLDDPGTADLFTEVSRGIDKALWFVEAHLQAERD